MARPPAPWEVRARFMQLPADVPEEVGKTAEEIRANYDTDTPYDAARAMERYLTSDANYTRADAAIEELLGDVREGFCVQFATSMALVAREMGVPSRVVYGATPGEEVAPGEYVVHGKNLHTWVEIYFPGVGWYPFDPTPGFGVPPAMEANDPTGPETPVATRVEPAADAPTADTGGRRSTGVAPVGAPATRQTGNEPGRGAIRVPAAFSLAPVLLLGGVPLLKRALAGRGTPGALYRDVAARLEDALWPESAAHTTEALTPAERLIGTAKAGGLDPRPFEELAGAYSEHMYSLRPSRDVRRPYDAAVRALAGLPRRRRLLGAFNPASLLRTLRRGLRARIQARPAWSRPAPPPAHHPKGSSR